jgi:cytochrome c553
MMKNLIKASLAIIVVAGLTTIGSAADLSGDATFKSKCAMCHGASGEGKAAMKTTPMKEAAAKSDADLTKIINDGIPNTSMKGYKGRLTDAQIKDLVAAIKSQK